jgi:hypothetical protein
MKSKFALLALIVCLLAGNSIFAQDKYLKIDFPEVDGWEKGEIVRYPVIELGYGLNYESETGGRVTIYVYNGGYKKIPNSAKDKLIKGEVEKAKNEIQMVEKMGRYKNVKELKDDTVMLGGVDGKIECAHKLFSMTVGADDLTSEIFVFSYQNHFIKVRATRLYEKEGTKNQAMNDLLGALDKMFAGDSTIAPAMN